MSSTLLALLLFPACGQTSTGQVGPVVKLEGVAKIRRDAVALEPLVTTELARRYLATTTELPAVAPRTLYIDTNRKVFLTEADSARLNAAARSPR